MISIGHGFLTISGERKKEEKAETGNYDRYERLIVLSSADLSCLLILMQTR